MMVNGYEIKQGADLRFADLQNADLQDANLRYANLQGADLQDADLQDADLRYVKGVKVTVTAVRSTRHE